MGSPHLQQPWEYCRVFCGTGLTLGATSPNLNGHPRLTPGLGLDDILTVLGAEGWELVGIIGDRASAQLIFKRPR